MEIITYLSREHRLALTFLRTENFPHPPFLGYCVEGSEEMRHGRPGQVEIESCVRKVGEASQLGICRPEALVGLVSPQWSPRPSPPDTCSPAFLSLLAPYTFFHS